MNENDRFIRRWLAAETSLDEERRLSRRLADASDASDADSAVAAVLRGAAALRGEPVPSFRRPAPRRRLLAWSAAAAVLIAAATWFAVRPTVYGYIDGRPVTDADEVIAAAGALERLDDFGRMLQAADSFTSAIPSNR